VILGSLIGFNLVAKIRLTPHGPTPVSAAGITTRLDVLMIDAIAVGLVLLWLTAAARLLAAAILLGLTLLYEVSKLVTYVSHGLHRQPQPASSTVHVVNTTQEHPQAPQQNSQAIGEGLLNQEKALFELWYQVRDGTLSRPAFAERVHPIRAALKTWLEEGASISQRNGGQL
jgi:hypothetical protein